MNVWLANRNSRQWTQHQNRVSEQRRAVGSESETWNRSGQVRPNRPREGNQEGCKMPDWMSSGHLPTPSPIACFLIQTRSFITCQPGHMIHWSFCPVGCHVGFTVNSSLEMGKKTGFHFSEKRKNKSFLYSLNSTQTSYFQFRLILKSLILRQNSH